MTPDQHATIEALREQGYAICLWSPDDEQLSAHLSFVSDPIKTLNKLNEMAG